MAMNSFDRDEFQAPLSEINTTPLVDVMLVLLVIFLVTAPMLNSSIKMNLPKEAAEQISEQKPMTVSINKEGKYYLNDEPLTDSALEEKLCEVAKTNPKQALYLRADSASAYGNVSHILAIVQRCKLSNVGFVTESK